MSRRAPGSTVSDRTGRMLLDVLWGRPLAAPGLASLDERGWQAVLETCRLHRVGPLLHWRLRGTPLADRVPRHVREWLEASHRRSTLRSLSLQAELARIHGILDARDIPHMALKGASLAFHAYPQPALRPMRDLDILVAPDRVMAAFAAFLDDGYEPTSAADPVGMLQESHHLPPLRSPTGGVHVEVHRSLTDSSTTGGRRQPLGADPGFWARSTTREVGRTSMTVPSDADMLLHLLVHATYAHRFDNGPLAIADLLFLLRRASVDWDLFWRLAEGGGWVPGCSLGLRVAQWCDGELPVGWPTGRADPVPEDMVRISLDLIRSDPAHRLDRSLRTALREESVGGGVRMLLRKAFPSPRVVARDQGVVATSAAVLAHYPRHWARLLFRRGPSFLRMLRDDRAGREAAAMATLDRWLDR